MPTKRSLVSEKPVQNACVNCRQSKLKCDDQRPCQRCVANGRQDTCHDYQPKARGRKASRTNERSSTHTSAPTTSGLTLQSIVHISGTYDATMHVDSPQPIDTSSFSTSQRNARYATRSGRTTSRTSLTSTGHSHTPSTPSSSTNMNNNITLSNLNRNHSRDHYHNHADCQHDHSTSTPHNNTAHPQLYSQYLPIPQPKSSQNAQLTTSTPTSSFLPTSTTPNSLSDPLNPHSNLHTTNNSMNSILQTQPSPKTFNTSSLFPAKPGFSSPSFFGQQNTQQSPHFNQIPLYSAQHIPFGLNSLTNEYSDSLAPGAASTNQSSSVTPSLANLTLTDTHIPPSTLPPTANQSAAQTLHQSLSNLKQLGTTSKLPISRLAHGATTLQTPLSLTPAINSPGLATNQTILSSLGLNTNPHQMRDSTNPGSTTFSALFPTTFPSTPFDIFSLGLHGGPSSPLELKLNPHQLLGQTDGDRDRSATLWPNNASKNPQASQSGFINPTSTHVGASTTIGAANPQPTTPGGTTISSLYLNGTGPTTTINSSSTAQLGLSLNAFNTAQQNNFQRFATPNMRSTTPTQSTGLSTPKGEPSTGQTTTVNNPLTSTPTSSSLGLGSLQLNTAISSQQLAYSLVQPGSAIMLAPPVTSLQTLHLHHQQQSHLTGLAGKNVGDLSILFRGRTNSGQSTPTEANTSGASTPAKGTNTPTESIFSRQQQHHQQQEEEQQQNQKFLSAALQQPTNHRYNNLFTSRTNSTTPASATPNANVIFSPQSNISSTSAKQPPESTLLPTLPQSAIFASANTNTLPFTPTDHAQITTLSVSHSSSALNLAPFGSATKNPNTTQLKPPSQLQQPQQTQQQFSINSSASLLDLSFVVDQPILGGTGNGILGLGSLDSLQLHTLPTSQSFPNANLDNANSSTSLPSFQSQRQTDQPLGLDSLSLATKSSSGGKNNVALNLAGLSLDVVGPAQATNKLSQPDFPPNSTASLSLTIPTHHPPSDSKQHSAIIPPDSDLHSADSTSGVDSATVNTRLANLSIQSNSTSPQQAPPYSTLTSLSLVTMTSGDEPTH